MSETPLISVIMPVYNVEKYLSACLNSLLAQTFSDFELICVNDGSTDSSAQILADFAAKDKRIKIINQQNSRQAAARNNGLSNAKGEYIYFMDSDDIIHHQLLEICLYQAQKFAAEMVCFGFSKHKDDKQKNIEKIKTNLCDNPVFRSTHAKHYRMTFNVWTKFFKKTLLTDIKFLTDNQYEDYVFVYEVLAKRPRTVFMDEKLYFYTVNPNSVSAQKIHTKQISDYAQGIEYLRKIYKKNDLQKERRYLKYSLIPTLLKAQLKKCYKAPTEIKNEMEAVFAKELFDLQQENMLAVRGNGIWRYFQYQKLLKGGVGTLKIVKLQGGLGNQMFQYAFGQALQNANPKDQVLYDVEWFKKAHKGKVAARELGLSLFGINPPQATPKQAKIFAGKNKIYNLFCPKIPRIIDAGWSKFRPEILHQSGNTYYNGYFQNEEYFATIKEQIRRDFTYPVLEKDDSFNQNWLKKINAAENPVCIHLRRGDYLNLAGWVLPLSYYQKAVSYIKAHIKIPTFFVLGFECDV